MAVTSWWLADNRGKRVKWGWSGLRAGYCHQWLEVRDAAKHLTVQSASPTKE